jgi:hypothetical protein
LERSLNGLHYVFAIIIRNTLEAHLVLRPSDVGGGVRRFRIVICEGPLRKDALEGKYGSKERAIV